MRKLTLLALVLCAVAPAAAWTADGHRRIARAAAEVLPPDAPAFLRTGADAIASSAVDPDLFRADETPQLAAAEGPQHYVDTELLRGRALPPTRVEYRRMLAAIGQSEASVGAIPYQVTEWAQRLELALAEYRQKPDDPNVRAKVIVFAGLLAHYAADITQPLHTTMDYDGRALPDGTSPFSGIHMLIDGLITRCDLTPADLGPRFEVPLFPSPFAATAAQAAESFSSVDRVYELEPALRAEQLSPELRAFALERYRIAVAFLAGLYRTAWERSAQDAIPGWYDEGAATGAQ